MALRIGFEQWFPGFRDQYWCRHTSPASPHEVTGAQCLSRRLILAVFELVFAFSLGGPTPSEAAGGRPQIQRSKTLGPSPLCMYSYYFTSARESSREKPLIYSAFTVSRLL